MTYSSGVASTSNSTVGSVVIGIVESVVPVDDASGSAQKIASIYLTVTPYDSYGGGSAINVLVPSGMASYAGGVAILPRVGESVVVLKSSGSWNYLIGAVNGTDHPWLFNPTTASDGSTTTNTPVKEGTGFRVPDLLSTNHDSGSPGSKPGMGNAQLLDENLFFTTGATLWDQGKAKKSHGNSGCSYGFGTVQESLKQAQDVAYESAKGLGFNEVMIRSRSASENTSTTSSSTTYDVAEGSMGGVSVYGQDYVDLWSTGTMSAQSKDNMNLSSGKVVRIEAGADVDVSVAGAMTVEASDVDIDAAAVEVESALFTVE